MTKRYKFKDAKKLLDSMIEQLSKTDQAMVLPRLKELFIKSVDALDEYNPNDIKPIISELKKYLSSNQINPIENFLEQFDYDEAKQEMLKLAKSLKIDLG